MLLPIEPLPSGADNQAAFGKWMAHCNLLSRLAFMVVHGDADYSNIIVTQKY
jgi:hypothetical protein